MLTPLTNADLSRSVLEYKLTVLDVLGVKKESSKSSSNKCTKTFYRDYSVHFIENVCATVLIYETLESTDEMKLMMKFTCVLLDNFSEL